MPINDFASSFFISSVVNESKRDLLPQLFQLNRIYDCVSQSRVIFLFLFFFSISFRIVRNKAAEKAKHVHHQQQSQNSGTPPGKFPLMAISILLLIYFFHRSGLLPQSPQMTTTDPQDSNGANSGPNSLNGNEGRISSGYSINGILGIQHSNDPNVNSMKRKRVDDHG